MISRNDVLRMAREALADVHWNVNGEPLSVLHSITGLERFAALVAAAEREACAKVCEDAAEDRVKGAISLYAALGCAAAIRARAGGT